MTEYTVIGKRVKRVDGVERVTGKAAFAADLHLPGMLTCRMLRSPHPHAMIRRIDTRKAAALDGVEAVITSTDFPELQAVGEANLGEMTIDMQAMAKLVMAHDKVLYEGHVVAAVAATDPFIAAQALDLIEVEYEVLPPVMDVLEAMKPDAPLLDPALRTQTGGQVADQPSNVAMRLLLGYGDVDQGFAEADVVLEQTYRTGMVHQGYIEPQSATARVEPDGRLTVWTTTQGSFTVRVQLRALLGLPESRIKVVPMEVGGAFGGKIFVHTEPVVALLAQKTGRPVKCVFSREEVLKGTGPGAPSVIRMKVGAKRDGTLTAIDTAMYYDAGAFPGGPIGRATVTGPAPYKTPNLRVDAYDIITNKPRVEAYRAPGATQAAFAFESHMDRMAEALGMDPLEFRRKNCAREGDPMSIGMPYNRIGLDEVYARVATHPAWTTPLETVPGKKRGRGLATGHWPGGAFTSSCRVSLNGDGSLEVVVGSVDLTGTRTTLSQIAAEAFGTDVERVTVTVGDTDSSDYTDVTGGSRITFTMSEALHKACQEALEELRQRAARHLEANVDDLEYVDQSFRVKGSPEKEVTLQTLALESTRGEGVVMGRGTVSRMGMAHQFAVHVADVAVDDETGKVTLLKYTAFQDVGRAINPTQVEGQIQGGTVQGIGWALNEEYVYTNGQLHNPTLLDYRMPVALDLPMIDTELIEVPAPGGEFGIRGVGEVPIVPPPAAIANAIYQATGVRLQELPMHPGRVLTALLESHGGG